MYRKHILPLMPRVETVESIHTRLKEYCESPDARLLLRAEVRTDRGGFWQAPDGSTIRWTDNSPASAMHRAACSGRNWTPDEFRELIHNLPTRVFDQALPINTAGYYVAHIFAVKPNRISGILLSRPERVARFIRNVHPANHFYVPNRPKGTGRRHGEDTSVIAFVASQYRERYARIWFEFLKLANASDIPSTPGAFDQMDVRFGDPGTRAPAAASKLLPQRIREKSQPLGESIFASGRTGCALLAESTLRDGHKRWVGNDQSESRHNGVVEMSESVDLRLLWRTSRIAPPKLIGCYRLNLRALLLRGYVRLDKPTEPDRVRLQFVHERDNGIYIRVREDSPRLYVGCFEDSSKGGTGGV